MVMNRLESGVEDIYTSGDLTEYSAEAASAIAAISIAISLKRIADILDGGLEHSGLVDHLADRLTDILRG
jgi:hypothetical protein